MTATFTRISDREATWESLVAPERDRYGRPLINGTAYTRASTLAKTLSDNYALGAWKAKIVARAVATNKDLAAAAATTNPDNKAEWVELIDRALTVGGAGSSATIGTAIHATTELLDGGLPTDGIPDEVLAAGVAYQEALAAANLRPVVSEAFVVNEVLGAAGSFDRLVEHTPTGSTAILDIKTSSRPDTPKFASMEWAIQCATYAGGQPACGQRGILSWESLGTTKPSQSTAVVCHIDLSGDAPRARLYTVDLVAGRDLAATAVEVRTARKVQKNLLGEL